MLIKVVAAKDWVPGLMTRGKQCRRAASGSTANTTANTALSLKGRCAVPALHGHRSVKTRVARADQQPPQTDKDVSGVAGGAASAEVVIGDSPISWLEREVSG